MKHQYLFLSSLPDRFYSPVLCLAARSQWRCEAPLWVRCLHWIPDKGMHRCTLTHVTVFVTLGVMEAAAMLSSQTVEPSVSLWDVLSLLRVFLTAGLFFSCPLVCVFSWQDGGTALTVASQYGHSKVVDTLLKNGANVHDQLNVSPFVSAFRPVSSHCQRLCLSGTWWLVAHNVPAAGIQPLRFLQTAESDTTDIWED